MTLAQRIGRFRVERALGSGSFSTVWLARDEDLDAWVAIKILAENWALNDDARRRFMDEARALRELDNDRIVRVYEVGRLEDARPYIVMEFADRGSLEDRMRFQAQMKRPFPVIESVGIGVEMAECLIAVHALRIVHRDVKPSNILFRSVSPGIQEALRLTGRRVDGERMLLGDFGVARRLESRSGHTIVVGSPQYMAPEQADAATAASVDERSDVYSAGIVLYELLAGQNPLSDGPAPLRELRPDVPVSLASAIARAMARDPGARFATAWEWREALVASMPDVEPAFTPWEALPGSAAGGSSGAPVQTVPAPNGPAPSPARSGATDLLPQPTPTRGLTVAPPATAAAPAAVRIPPTPSRAPGLPVAPKTSAPTESLRPRPALGAFDCAYLATVAGLVLGLGCLFPWRDGPSIADPRIGIHLHVGTYAFAAAGAILLAALGRWPGRGRWSLRFVWLVAGLAGLVALGATGWEAFRTWRLVRHAGFDQVRAGVGVGLYMAFAGALLGLAAASRARRQLRTMRLLRIRQAVPAPPGPTSPSEHAAPPTP